MLTHTQYLPHLQSTAMHSTSDDAGVAVSDDPGRPRAMLINTNLANSISCGTRKGSLIPTAFILVRREHSTRARPGRNQGSFIYAILPRET